MTDECNEAVEKVAQAVERFDFNGDDYHPEWGRAVAQAALDAINYEATLADLAAMREENERLREGLRKIGAHCPGAQTEAEVYAIVVAALDAAHREEHNDG